MKVYAYPEVVTNTLKLDSIENVVPLCFKVDTLGNIGDDLVICPMLGGKLLTLGCCIDAQGVIQGEDYDDGYLYDQIFSKGSKLAGIPPSEMIDLCLRHQIEVLEALIPRVRNPQQAVAVEKRIREIKATLGIT